MRIGAILRHAMAAAVCTAAISFAVVQGPGVSAQRAQDDPEGLYSFENLEAFEEFVERMQPVSSDPPNDMHSWPSPEWSEVMETARAAPPAPIAMDVAADSASSDGEQDTDIREAGIDEAAIVKVAGDHLVILRRGRIFTIRHSGDTLRPVATINAFPPDAENAGRTWYNEMLVRGDQVIVVGYSFDDFGTEINRFRLGSDGSLTYRDTHYLRGGDYYSSRNYVSRTIGDELIFYARVYMNWRDWRSTLPALRRSGPDGEVVDLVEPENIFLTEPARSALLRLPAAHTLTRCDLSAAELECEATAVLGNLSRGLHFSGTAIYIWTGGSRLEGGHAYGQLYRLPLDGSRPGAVPVHGAPIDQFSFAEDGAEGVLRVFFRGDGFGYDMWGDECYYGDLGLLTVPLGAFTDGTEILPQGALRQLPAVYGLRTQNRFAGDYLLYAGATYDSEDAPRVFYAAPLDEGPAQRIELAHGVTRIDLMGSHAVAIGQGPDNTLGLSALSLGENVAVEDVYMLPAASEGEVRSQAFVYRPDRGSEGGLSGTLGLSVTRQRTNSGSASPGGSSTIFFLRRDNREFSPAGQLISRARAGVDDGCVASCVDWYGNAGPIFLGERIFALMGYELVEGRIENGTIREVRRTNFTPESASEERPES